MPQQLPPGFELDPPSSGLPQGFTLDAAPIAEETELSAALELVRSVSDPRAKFNRPQARGSAFGAASGRGLLFGLDDELLGLEIGLRNVGKERSLSAFGPGFRAGRLVANAQNERDRAAFPGATLTGEITGGVATGAGIGAGLARLGAGRRATAALAGGVPGGLAGAAEGETLGERGRNAAIGAGFGSLFGVIGDEAVRFIGQSTARAITNALNRIRTSARMRIFQQAFRTMQRSAQADEQSEAAFRRQVRQFLDEGDPNDFLFEQFGANTREHTRAAASAAKANKTFAQNALDARQLAQQNRLNAELANSVSDLPVGQARAEIQRHFAGRGSQLFEEAFAVEPTAAARNQVGALRSRVPIVDDAFKAAERQMAKFGDDAGQFFRVAHEAKEILDDQIGVALRNGQNKLAKRLIEQKNALRGILADDAVNPRYGEALRFWAGNAADDNALDAGLKIFSLDEEDLVNLGRGFSNSERSHFVAGVAKAVRQRFEGAGATQNATNRLRATSLRNKLRQILSPDEADAFFETLAREEQRVLNRNFVDPRTGSQTQLRQAGQEAFQRAGRARGAAAELIENPLGFARAQRGRQQLANFIRGGDVDEDLADAFVELALTRGGQAGSPLEELLAEQAAPFVLPPGVAGGATALTFTPLLLQNQ